MQCFDIPLKTFTVRIMNNSPQYLSVIGIQCQICSRTYSDRISFMNKTNRIGPSMEPWGTPELTGTLLHLSPPISYNNTVLFLRISICMCWKITLIITTHRVLFCRYDLMKFNVVPFTKYWYCSF